MFLFWIEFGGTDTLANEDSLWPHGSLYVLLENLCIILSKEYRESLLHWHHIWQHFVVNNDQVSVRAVSHAHSLALVSNKSSQRRGYGMGKGWRRVVFILFTERKYGGALRGSQPFIRTYRWLSSSPLLGKERQFFVAGFICSADGWSRLSFRDWVVPRADPVEERKFSLVGTAAGENQLFILGYTSCRRTGQFSWE